MWAYKLRTLEGHSETTAIDSMARILYTINFQSLAKYYFKIQF